MQNQAAGSSRATDADRARERDERRTATASTRELLDAAKENESMRAEMSTLDAQLAILQRALEAAANVQRQVRDLQFRWSLRVVETVSNEDDRKCSGKPRTVRVVGTLDRPNRT